MAVQELLRRLRRKRLIAFGAIAAALAVSATLALGPHGKASKADFRAVVEKVGESRMLIVSGRMTTPTGGWTAALQPSAAKGGSPDVLSLKLTMTPPAGPAAQVVSTISVRYAGPMRDAGYRQVAVSGDGVFTLDIEGAR